MIAVTTPLGTTSNFYDTTTGRLTKVSRTGMADTLYEYNSLGEQTVTCLDVDGDGMVDYAGLDRINRINRIYELRSNDWWQVTINEVWAETNSAVCITSSISRVRMTGLGTDTYNGGILTEQSQSEDWLGNPTRTSTYTDAGSITSWTVTDAPDSNVDAVQKSIAGYPVQTVSSTAITNNFTYDGFARVVETTKNTNGHERRERTAYNALGQLAYVEDAASNRTSFVYNSLGQRTGITNALGEVSLAFYDAQGRTLATWGTSYPVAYQFDTAGRMVALATTRSNAYANVNLNTLVPSGETLSSLSTENSALDITRWCYDGTTGLLTGKLYADGNGTAYTYTENGRLSTRTWARGITTTYSYDGLGQLTEVDYSDSTPDVVYTYDRLGRIRSAVSTASSNLFEYIGLALSKETQSGYIIEFTYDYLGRATGYELYSPDDLINPVQTIIYGYSDNGRFNSVSSVHSVVTNTFTYAFLPGTDLISGYSLSQGGAAASLTVSRSYESDRNLITAITNAWNTVVISSFIYENDQLSRRTRRFDWFNSLLSTNVFDYNIFGELIEASMNSGTDIYNIDYDPIGNRCTSVRNSVINTYTANNLNQYTSITGGAAASPTYDSDGNMTYDGSTWHHTYDAENRLIGSSPNTVTNGSVMLEYAYNYKNLRVEKIKKQLSGRDPGYPMNPQADPGTWDAIETRRYIWDGYNIAAEIIIDHVTPATNISCYTWGLDLSGTLQGAGGVGGLLAETKATAPSTNTYYACADVNGNITEYVDENGLIVAHGEHNAFGETKIDGSMKDNFTHWFSSKPLDKTTGLISYDLRYLKPDFAWLSRDPIGIMGGLNEYGFLNNNPVNLIDPIGLKWTSSLMGIDFYFAYQIIVPPTTTGNLGSITEPFKGGRAFPKFTKFVEPEHEKTGKGCYCIKANTGIVDIEVQWWKVKMGLPGYDDLSTDVQEKWKLAIERGFKPVLRTDSVGRIKDQSVANYMNWHEQTEVAANGVLFKNTIGISESRIKENTCPNGNMTLDELKNYIKWSEAVEAYRTGVDKFKAAFDPLYGPKPVYENGKRVLIMNTPSSNYQVSDYLHILQPMNWE